MKYYVFQQLFIHIIIHMMQDSLKYVKLGIDEMIPIFQQRNMAGKRKEILQMKNRSMLSMFSCIYFCINFKFHLFNLQTCVLLVDSIDKKNLLKIFTLLVSSMHEYLTHQFCINLMHMEQMHIYITTYSKYCLEKLRKLTKRLLPIVD